MDSDRCSVCLSDFPLNTIKNYNHKDKKCLCILKCCDDCNNALSNFYTCLICRNKSERLIQYQREEYLDILLFCVGE